MQEIIAVINQKGGVGKTTTSINLSSGLAMEGKRVLLIDLDPQAHSTLGLGVEPRGGKPAIHDVLIKRDVNNAILQTKIDNLFLIPSHIHLDKTEQLLTPEMFKESYLHKAIRNLDYDYIIIDCRPTLGTLTINAIYACNTVLVPCEIGRYALEGFFDLMDTVNKVQDGETDNQSKRIKILLNKFDSRTKVSNAWVFRELDQYKDLILITRIRKNEALNQAHMAQEPVFLYDKNSQGAQDYGQLTQEVLNICQNLVKN